MPEVVAEAEQQMAVDDAEPYDGPGEYDPSRESST
jgi:hypothetical protein